MNKILMSVLTIFFSHVISFAATDAPCNEKNVIATIRHFDEVKDFFKAFENIKKDVIYSMDDRGEITLLNDPRPRIVLHPSDNESEQGIYIIDVIEDRYVENRVLTFVRYYYDVQKNILFKYDEVTGKKKTISIDLTQNCK